MKRKLLCLVLTLCLALSLLPFGAAAADVVDSGKCGDNLTYSLDSEGVLTITGSGAMQDYAYVVWRSEEAAPWAKKVTEVVLTDGITSIGNFAFAGCDELKKISFPDSVTEIGSYAFFYCENLEEIKLPGALKSIASLAFCGCPKVETIALPGTLERADYAFANCEGMKSIDLGTCTVDFHKTFCASVSYDDVAVLKQLETIKVADSNTAYMVKDHDLYSKDGKTLICHPASFTDSYTVSPDVTTIGAYAFGNSQAAAVEIGSNVTKIAYGAFRGASNLKRVEIPDSVTTLEESVLRNCASLETVVLPEGLDTLPNATFLLSRALKSVYIPKVASLGHAFSSYGEFADADVYYGGSEEQFNSATILSPTQHYVRNEETNEYEMVDYKSIELIPENYEMHYNHVHTWDEGKVTKEAAPGVEGVKTFTCTVCTKSKLEKIDALPVVEPENPFKDVADGLYYTKPVIWAVNHDPQITTGTTATTFEPDASCTRGQMVTFLWRAAGCPEPTTTKNPFKDVNADTFYYKAVLWAAEKSITTGTTPTTFAPDETVNRAQAVTFLWRFGGEQKATAANPFKDVADGQYYTTAVLWAAENGITTGTTATTFEPDNPCVRGQIVTFLYRNDQK